MGAFDYGAKQVQGIKPNGLINGVSALVAGPYTGSAVGNVKTIKTVVTGALVADVLSPVLKLSGKGSISFLAVFGTAVTRTQRCKVTIDGVVVFDGTSTSGFSATVHQIIGDFSFNTTNNTSYRADFEPLIFDTSLLIEYASSLTETGNCSVAYRYTPRA